MNAISNELVSVEEPVKIRNAIVKTRISPANAVIAIARGDTGNRFDLGPLTQGGMRWVHPEQASATCFFKVYNRCPEWEAVF